METSRLSVPAVSLSRDLRRSLRLARDLGVHAIELDGRNGLDPAQVTETGLRQIRKWLGDEGLVVSGISFQTRGGYGEANRLEGRDDIWERGHRYRILLAVEAGASAVGSRATLRRLPPRSDERTGSCRFCTSLGRCPSGRPVPQQSNR